MSSIASSLSALIHSLISLITDAFNSVYSVVATLFATVAAFIGGVVGLTADTAGFILSNFFVLAILAGGVFGYIKYQERNQGRARIGGGKKTL